MEHAQPSLVLAILFFLAYVAISIFIGIVSSRRETEEDFMIAGRKVRGIQMMATMAAGWFDGVTLATFIAYVYLYGFPALSLFIGIGGGFLLFRFFASRIKRTADKLKVYSMPEFFSILLGKKNGILFSVFIIIQFAGYLLINFILSGKVLAQLFPSLPYPFAVAVGGVIILIYLLLAGFKAVVRTDFYQLLIMIVMTLLAATFLVGRTSVTSADFDLGRIGAGNIIGFLAIAGFGVMVAPDIWQRVFAAQDEVTLKKGLAYTALILPALAVIIAVVGLATKQALPGIQAEDALVRAFTTLFPLGIKEFALVLLYAVALSSSDTVTFVISSILTRDLKNYAPNFSDQSMTQLTRIIMCILVIAAVLVAASYQNIIQIILSLGSLNLALFPVVFGTLFWQLKKNAVFWSLVVTLGTVAILSLTKSLTPETAVLSLPVASVALIVFQLLFKGSRGERIPTS
jgi:solute:Na+ symporter, SSS family